MPLFRNGPGRGAQHGASRPGLLQHRTRSVQMTNGFSLQLDEARGSGQIDQDFRPMLGIAAPLLSLGEGQMLTKKAFPQQQR